MTNSTETKTITLSIPTQWADLAHTVWGKALVILTAASIVMGVLMEFEGVVTGFFDMEKAGAEAAMSITRANGLDRPPPQLPRDNTIG
jgi:hypothetical protein